MEQVLLIQQLYAAGLSSKLVRDVLPKCLDRGELPDGFAERLIAERARIDRQIADMTAVRLRLDDLIAAAQDPAVGGHATADFEQINGALSAEPLSAR